MPWFGTNKHCCFMENSAAFVVTRRTIKCPKKKNEKQDALSRPFPMRWPFLPLYSSFPMHSYYLSRARCYRGGKLRSSAPLSQAVEKKLKRTFFSIKTTDKQGSWTLETAYCFFVIFFHFHKYAEQKWVLHFPSASVPLQAFYAIHPIFHK